MIKFRCRIFLVGQNDKILAMLNNEIFFAFATSNFYLNAINKMYSILFYMYYVSLRDSIEVRIARATKITRFIEAQT